MTFFNLVLMQTRKQFGLMDLDYPEITFTVKIPKDNNAPVTVSVNPPSSRCADIVKRKIAEAKNRVPGTYVFAINAETGLNMTATNQRFGYILHNLFRFEVSEMLGSLDHLIAALNSVKENEFCAIVDNVMKMKFDLQEICGTEIPIQVTCLGQIKRVFDGHSEPDEQQIIYFSSPVGCKTMFFQFSILLIEQILNEIIAQKAKSGRHD